MYGSKGARGVWPRTAGVSHRIEASGAHLLDTRRVNGVAVGVEDTGGCQVVLTGQTLLVRISVITHRRCYWGESLLGESERALKEVTSEVRFVG